MIISTGNPFSFIGEISLLNASEIIDLFGLKPLPVEGEYYHETASREGLTLRYPAFNERIAELTEER